jgi:hypothetical protein
MSDGNADGWDKLSPSTRHWIENLRKEDIAEINKAIETYRAVNTTSRAVKWIVITIVACFVGAAALGESIQKIISLIFHGGKQ